MNYPKAVIEKAHKMGKLLQRIEAGESLDQVCAKLGVDVDEKRLATLQKKYRKGGETWQALLDGRFGHTQTVHLEMREWLYERKKQDETLRAPKLAEEIEKRFGLVVSTGHINYLLRKRGLTAPTGRPYKAPPAEQKEEPSPTSIESLDNAGTFFPGSSQGGDGSSSDD